MFAIVCFPKGCGISMNIKYVPQASQIEMVYENTIPYGIGMVDTSEQTTNPSKNHNSATVDFFPHESHFFHKAKIKLTVCFQTPPRSDTDRGFEHGLRS